MGTPARYYSSTAVRTTLATSVSSTDTEIVVASSTNFPTQYPFTLILEKDSANEEIVSATAKIGTSFVVIRGFDGTAARSHAAGTSVEHGVSAKDFTDFRSHEAASNNVHDIGAGSSVVGTDTAQTLTNKALTAPTINGGSINATTLQVGGVDAVTTTGSQTLTNKTLTAPSINNAVMTGTSLSAPTVGDFSNAQHDHSTAAKGGNIPQSSVTGLVSGLASKESVTNVASHTNATTAHGATGAVVGTTNTQTLTNKTLTNPTINAATVTGSVTATGSTVTGGTLSGQTITGATLGGNLTAANNKITGLGTPTTSTDAATKGYVDTSVSALVDAAPGTLDTLNELAAALGDDPNFATTVTNSIATKVSKSGDTMTGNLAFSGGAKITGLPAPTNSGDATPKSYIDQLYGSTASAEQSDASAAQSAIEAAQSAGEASDSADAALASQNAAAISESNSAVSAAASATSASQSSTSASNSATSASASAASQAAAAASEIASASSASSSAASAVTAESAKTAALGHATDASDSADLAQDWAIKTDGPVAGGEFSAKYWAGVANTSNSVSANTVDAKGDLIAGAADNTVVRVPVGTDDQVLMADSTTGSGLKWGTVDVSGEIATHNADTTNVHGIADTADLATKSYADTAAANAAAALVDSAPGTLDTLNELAAALGDDPNFASTVATQIGLKADLTDARFTDQRVPVDGSITNAKVSASAAIEQSKIANLTSDLAAKAPLASPSFTGTTTVVSPTAAGSNGVRNITMSTSAPTGGSDGDVWLVYT